MFFLNSGIHKQTAVCCHPKTPQTWHSDVCDAVYQSCGSSITVSPAAAVQYSQQNIVLKVSTGLISLSYLLDVHGKWFCTQREEKLLKHGNKIFRLIL